MPALLTPGQKPVGAVKIDWSNPLTQNLERYYGSTGYPRDLVTGQTFVPLNTNWQQAACRAGQGVGNSATTAALSTSTVPAVGTGDYTFFAHFYFDVEINWSYFCSVGTTTGTPIGIGITNATKAYLYSGGVYNGSTVLVQGRIYTVVGRRKGTAVAVFLNGRSDGTGTSTANFVTADPFNLLAQKDNGTFSENDGRIVLSAGFARRAWSDDDIRAFAEDPYQIIKPLAPISYFIPTPGAGGLSIPIAMNNYYRQRI